MTGGLSTDQADVCGHLGGYFSPGQYSPGDYSPPFQREKAQAGMVYFHEDQLNYSRSS